MSLLGNFIAEEIKRQKIEDGEMAAKLGLGKSHLSQIKRGIRPSLNDETLAKLVHHISDDPTVRAGVLQAFLRDRALPDMKDWINVSPPHGSGRVKEETPAVYGDPIKKVEQQLRALALPTKTVESLSTIIAALPSYDHLQELVNELASFTHDAFPHGRVFEETLSAKQIAGKKLGGKTAQPGRSGR